MGIEADQAKQLRDVDYALAHLASLSATVAFKTKDDSTYGRRNPYAVVQIRNTSETVERSQAVDDGNHNVQWLIDIGNKAFEMYVKLAGER